ncbi:putative EXO1-exonuclease which interacts with Msh2p [Fusarium austroafricanum]|uniref:Putative EXO1-exonuclease which interacts with Msh2p n=1 Tax=Fusarium austroafricanum TaxID=2364996 RepID=A0A8H4KRV5_9HYPO|nr:putative EXO1-exonuclease which interacts with Msh2p [Fusarium austroafricanum]
MGVSGLLPLLKSIQKPTELKKYNGQILGVDAYGWLHRAAYCCALELGQDKPTQKYLNAAMTRVRMLRHFGVTPYMVFDGDFLPSKAATEDSRAKKRDEKKRAAMELLRTGKPAQATQEFQKCIDITPEMASALIQLLKKLDIPYVVAPYEADAQLVYLERQGLINGIISDDSDLLVFGAKKLLTKLDQYGNCIEINRKDFCACREVSLTGWSDTEFRRMAILSGCDYLDGLPGVGLKTAYRMLRKTKAPERIVRMVQFQGKRVSENYLTQFYQAELTFLHQWVFCPTKRELVHLTDLDGTRTAEEMPFIGAFVEPELARAIASGDMNPITKTSIVTSTTPSKRRHSQLANSAIDQPPPTMKPISSYFKGHGRIPMGEMDPNCFEVDPQRVSQITGGGLVPRVFPLPRPYLDETARPTLSSSRRSDTNRVGTSPRLHRRRTEPISNMLGSLSNNPTTTRRTSSTGNEPCSSAAPSTDPANRPPKKARLCDENETGLDEALPQKSRFFPAPKPRRSPRRAKSDAYLLSDDSLDEALLALPDFEGWKPADKTKKSVPVFEEKESQETSATGDNESQASFVKDEETPMSSFDSSVPPPSSTASLSRVSSTPSRPDILQFSYSKPTETPVSTASRRSSVFSTASTPSTAPSTAVSRMTPLQRLGVRAMNPPNSPKLPKPRNSIDKQFLPGVPVNPAFVPLPKVNLDEVADLNKCGSEDQIIPASDEEDEDKVDLPPKKLNLSRFAFT